MTAAMPSRSFGQTPAGRDATLFTLENDRLGVCITDFGGRMVSVEAPDRYGHRDHVLLGFDTVAAYASNSGSFGAPVRVHDPAKGRVLEVHTNQPCTQVYTASKLIGRSLDMPGPFTANPPDWPWSLRIFPRRRIIRTFHPPSCGQRRCIGGYIRYRSGVV